MRGNVECSAKSDIVFGAETKGGNKIFGGMGLLVLVVFERKKEETFQIRMSRTYFYVVVRKNIIRIRIFSEKIVE